MCGERAAVRTSIFVEPGSSPRVRGTQKGRQRCRDHGRFIPACAGNARRNRWSARHSTVHPRVCGERKKAVSGAETTAGSSPRVRGTRLWRWSCIGRRRFIPACAGNAGARTAPKYTCAVHPRVCGERAFITGRGQDLDGSSPRVRGTRYISKYITKSDRFIPACAGNATPPANTRLSPPVHPRVCGERDIPPVSLGGGAGSSPRVRGTPEVLFDLGLRSRFIPACAGNAIAPAPRGSGCSVHPRVCGERDGLRGIVDAGGGSSPRVRGTRKRRNGPEKIAAVHPRVCGERPKMPQRFRGHHGSSPRVRGTHRERMGRHWLSRFIPACAGNACSNRCQGCHYSVHPRVCGERGGRCGVDRHRGGSSPRVRGTPNLSPPR